MKLSRIAGLFSLMLTLSVQAEDAKHCIQQFDGTNLQGSWGEHCGSSDSLSLTVTNTCDKPIYVKVCLEKPDGQVDCGSHTDLAPGETDTGFWTCHSNGNYRWAACTGGSDECGF